MQVKAKALPDVEALHKRYRYDAETGYISRNGRARTSFRESAEYYGVDPESEIDHINGNPADNRIVNLRLADRSRNMANARRYSSNTSGFKGVYFRKDNGKWRAGLTVGKQRQWLGQFDTAEEAQAVVAIARERLHGDFANNGI